MFMNKKKAVVCTILLSVVVGIALIGSIFVENKNILTSYNLYYIILSVFGFVKIYELIGKFYHWILVDSTK